MSTTHTESALVQGPPSLPDANAGETGQGENAAAETENQQAQGTEAEAATAETESTPEPAEASGAAESEQGEAAGGEEEAEAAEAAGEEEVQASAEYPDWLPYEPLKAYPDELLQLAAKQFGVPQEQLNQKWAKDLLTGKLNALVRERNASLAAAVGEEDAGGESDEEGKAEASAEGEGAEEGEPEKLTLPQLQEQAEKFVSQFVTPEGSSLYATQLKGSMDALYDAHQSGDKDAIAKAEQGLVKTQMTFMTMALRELAPHLMQGLVDSRLDSRINEYQQETRTYSEARKRLSTDPRYASLDKFIKGGALKAVLQKHGDLINKQFYKVVNGKRVKMDPIENAMEQYKTAMTLHRGANGTPAPVLVRRAQDKAKQQADAMQNKRELGRTAAGRATGKLPGTGGETSQEYVDRLKQAAATEDPLTGGYAKRA